MARQVARLVGWALVLAAPLCALSCLPSPISWSPDSARIAFVSPMGPVGGPLWSADVASGACTKLRESANGLGAPAWSPDGRRLALLEAPEGEKGAPTLLLLAPGGETTKFPLEPDMDLSDRPKGGEPALYPHLPSWRPDGKAVAVSYPTTGGDVQLVVDTATGKTLWKQAGTACAAWAPDGKSLAAVQATPKKLAIVLIAANDWTLKSLWATETEEDDDTPAPAWLYTPAWSRDGKKLAIGGGLVIDVATGEAKDLDLDGTVTGPSWSPDGKQLACSVTTQGKGSLIQCVDLATGKARNLATGAGEVWMLFGTAWSPNGAWIAYLAQPMEEGPPAVLCVVSPDGERHKAFYTSDDHMLALAAHFAKEAADADEDDAAALRKQATALLDELPKRFPKTELGDAIREVRDALAKPE